MFCREQKHTTAVLILAAFLSLTSRACDEQLTVDYRKSQEIRKKKHKKLTTIITRTCIRKYSYSFTNTTAIKYIKQQQLKNNKSL